MKVLLGAAVMALLVASPAVAQTDADAPSTQCGAIAPPPTLPDGATAEYAAMEAGNAAFRAWAESNRSVLECRRQEVEAAQARYQALRNEFNAGADQLNATNASWEAEVAEFNERNPQPAQQRRRDPRSVTN